jgi:ATP-dependent RNA helicase RhlE
MKWWSRSRSRESEFMTRSFSDVGLSDPIVRALHKRGITEPFAIQRAVIGDVLQGRDVLAKSPTGSGKTLAFAAPMMDLIKREDKRPSALILAPTRELAAQIVAESRPLAQACGLSITAVYGGVGIVKQARLAASAHIVVATPGRLEDLLQRRDLSLEHVRLLVLDEADRMLDMGFKPAVDRIVRQTRRERQTLFFSATLDGSAGRVAESYTSNPVRHEHNPPERQDATVEHRFRAVEDEHKLRVLTEELRAQRDLALVFVRTKRGADRLVKRLAGEGIEAEALHGNKSQGQRDRALARFQAGAVDVLVATDVAARGLDVDDISHVINFDPPADREGYIHRVGRTARAGRRGVGLTLVSSGESRAVSALARTLRLEPQFADAHPHLSKAPARDAQRVPRQRPPARRSTRRERPRPR